MNKPFNKGEPYHGEKVMEGRLRGSTDTDDFYFFCPDCEDNRIMRILDFSEHKPTTPDNKYNDDFKQKAEIGFTLVFKLYCEQCNLTDFVKISNEGLQGGRLHSAELIAKSTHA